jgi:hypothetical protein
MRTFESKVKPLYSDVKTLSVAAPTFLEAWKKIKAIMRRNRRRYTILSIVQTAKLDA